ncbi:MAG TPA: type II secretion system F family protein, partial [Candidatus Hydrogenedentes bacterium]|nr:type II secretion system F family protein [Candidatus Hydrogenedentota bacterium]
MTTFSYEAIRQPGETVTGEIEADDHYSAAATLTARGYHVLHVEDADAQAASRMKIRLGFLRGLKHRDLVRFTRDLATLLRAGFPLSHALDRVRVRTGSSGWRAVAGGIRSRLENGQTFSNAITGYPGVFDPMYVSLVRSGEESGKLANVLNRIADLGEKREELQSRVKMALVYPALMLLMGFVTVFILVSFVVPMFTEVFRDTGQTLPFPTRALVNLSSFLSTWWWLVLPLIGAAAFAAIRFLGSPNGRALRDRMLLSLPVVNNLIRQNEIAAFSRTLGTLLDSGVTVVAALEIAAATLRNSSFREAVKPMSAAVRGGQSLSRTIEASDLFPDLVANVVSVGEESGDLRASFLQLAEENERELDRAVKVALTLLEP